jgi:hypothetical protein
LFFGTIRMSLPPYLLMSASPTRLGRIAVTRFGEEHLRGYQSNVGCVGRCNRQQEENRESRLDLEHLAIRPIVRIGYFISSSSNGRSTRERVSGCPSTASNRSGTTPFRALAGSITSMVYSSYGQSYDRTTATSHPLEPSDRLVFRESFWRTARPTELKSIILRAYNDDVGTEDNRGSKQ